MWKTSTGLSGSPQGERSGTPRFAKRPAEEYAQEIGEGPLAEVGGSGILAWAKCATTVIPRGQSLAAKNATYHLIPKGQSLRIDPDVPDNLLRLDRVSPDELLGRAEQESRFVKDQVRQIFLDHHAGAYTPSTPRIGARPRDSDIAYGTWPSRESK
jgi:hypothetical protein